MPERSRDWWKSSVSEGNSRPACTSAPAGSLAVILQARRSGTRALSARRRGGSNTHEMRVEEREQVSVGRREQRQGRLVHVCCGSLRSLIGPATEQPRPRRRGRARRPRGLAPPAPSRLRPLTQAVLIRRGPLARDPRAARALAAAERGASEHEDGSGPSAWVRKAAESRGSSLSD